MSLRRLILQNKHRARFLREFTNVVRRGLIASPVPDWTAKAFGREGRPLGVVSYRDLVAADSGGFTLVYPEEKQVHTLPKCFGGELPPTYHEHLEEIGPEGGVLRLRNARYWGKGSGLVITADGWMVKEFSREVFNPEESTPFYTLAPPPLEERRETVAVLTTQGAESNFYHWTIDLLPRIHLLRQALGSLDGIDFFLVNHQNRKWQLESLADAGVPLDRVVVPTSRTHWRVSDLVVPTVKLSLGPLPRWTVKALAELPKEPVPGYPRIYVSRRPPETRCLTNEAEIEPLLEAKGYRKVYADQFNTRQQRALFADAEAIVGIHGAALANTIFCQPGTDFIEIMPDGYWDLSFFRTGSLARLKFSMTTGAKSSKSARASSWHSDFSVNSSDLEALVEVAEQ